MVVNSLPRSRDNRSVSSSRLNKPKKFLKTTAEHTKARHLGNYIVNVEWTRNIHVASFTVNTVRSRTSHQEHCVCVCASKPFKVATNDISRPNPLHHRFQWPRCLERRSTAARLLGLRVLIPPAAWMFVSSERCVFSSIEVIASG